MTDIEDLDFGNMLDGTFSIVTEEIHEQNTESKKKKKQTSYPILPVRNMVMFPKIVVPITAGREQSKLLIEDAERNGNEGN